MPFCTADSFISMTRYLNIKACNSKLFGLSICLIDIPILNLLNSNDISTIFFIHIVVNVKSIFPFDPVGNIFNIICMILQNSQAIIFQSYGRLCIASLAKALSNRLLKNAKSVNKLQCIHHKLSIRYYEQNIQKINCRKSATSLLDCFHN